MVELTPETVEAIEQGVAWLAREQVDRGGYWPSKPTSLYRVSVTALAGLALLAHGDTPRTGPYAENLRRCIHWVLSTQHGEPPWKGLLFDWNDPAGREARPMHGHGFALLFLTQAYGQTRDTTLRGRLRGAIAEACRLTERSISPQGGWYYHPGDRRDEGSVTITQIQALRAARNVGIWVDPTTIERAVSYIKRSQQEDGGIRYTLDWGRTSPALTAAGISVLQGAGEYHSEAIERAYVYLRQNLITGLPDRQQFFFYTHLYAAQANFQRGGPDWASYFPDIRLELLELRRGRPYWESHFGKTYGTSIALLILQLPLRYLPIYQR